MPRLQEDERAVALGELPCPVCRSMLWCSSAFDGSGSRSACVLQRDHQLQVQPQQQKGVEACGARWRVQGLLRMLRLQRPPQATIRRATATEMISTAKCVDLSAQTTG